ncbi:hypothetical protein [Bacillus thuringiensis]|uniref:hypothetical protein n=1 Tax=Bacillus thuringiensis TaxID=1428 RepID=UPI0005CEEDA9|nr:hypothetical protein [Bacillus thuringiensis]
MDAIEIVVLKPVFDPLARQLAMILFIPTLITVVCVATLNKCNLLKFFTVYGILAVFLFSVYKMFELFNM